MLSKKYPLIIVAVVLLVITLSIFLRNKSNTNIKVSDNMGVDNTIGVQTDMKITSSAFKEGEMIPAKYTCDAENISPPLLISEVPSDAKSFVLIVDDPDAPMGTWTHLLAWNIDPTITDITEGKIPDSAVIGKSDFGKNKYGGPCPPSGAHRYYFRLYALDTSLDLDENASRSDLEKAMEGHVISSALLMGTYAKAR